MEPKNIIIKDIDTGLYVYDELDDRVTWTTKPGLALGFESMVDAQDFIDSKISSNINVDTITL